MSKDNLFLGMARGSVGDVTFSRLNGVQVARARNRAPHNPQSPAQMVQRIVMSTVGKAYSFMRAICDHSFEGFESGQGSQRKFMEVNVGILRDRLADVLAYPVREVIESSDVANFTFKNDVAPVLNRYQISAGSLPSLSLWGDATQKAPVLAFDPGELTSQTITYQDLINLLGLQRGDQLTFIQTTGDATEQGRPRSLMTGFRYARVILEPSDGDMTSPLLNGSAINKPNERNEGSFRFLGVQNIEESGRKGLLFTLSHVDVSTQSDKFLEGSAVILSRFEGGKWRRSEQFLEPLLLSPSAPMFVSPISAAYETYRLSASSDLYLNQAT